LIGNCSTLQALYFGMSDPCVADRANNEKHKQTSGCLRIGSLDFIASSSNGLDRSTSSLSLDEYETLDVKRMN